VNQVDVFLGDIRVGEIERFVDQFGPHVFRFDGNYLRLAHRPVLGQLFEDRIPRDIETDSLTPWFEHLLPPSGSPLRRAVARAAALDDEDGLGILAWLGDELPGAVRVRARTGSASYRRGPVQLPLVPDPSPFRLSLAGNQWKLSLGRAADGKLTLPLTGKGEWIAKFHGPDFPHLARVEYGTMSWAAAAGLPTPRHELVRCEAIADLPAEVPTGDGYAFIIERFDRLSTGRVHAEDFGQIFDRPPGQTQFSESYEAIAAFLHAEAAADVDSFIERVVFMVLSGNADAHLKNWAVTYVDQRRPALAPCYDLVSTVVYPRLGRSLALKLNDMQGTKFEGVTPESFDLLSRITHRDTSMVRDHVSRFAAKAREAWQGVRDILSIEERNVVQKHLSSLKL
jgi:serine/threonine-protein kinase HipA